MHRSFQIAVMMVTMSVAVCLPAAAGEYTLYCWYDANGRSTGADSCSGGESCKVGRSGINRESGGDYAQYYVVSGDDGNACPALLPKIAFVTSEKFSGDLGGISGADEKCQRLATAATLKGRFKAWISDGVNSPSTTFVQASASYRRTDGAQIAANWADLTDGQLDVKIDRYENGNFASDMTGPWTGTNPDGTPHSLNCAAWTDGTSNGCDRRITPDCPPGRLTGWHGCTSTDSRQWTSCGQNWCGEPDRGDAYPRPLYCFEQ